MKAEIAKQDGESGATAAVAPAEASRAGEQPSGDQPDADEALEPFKEAPTVANRALPAPEGGAEEEVTAAPRGGAGSYRLVRPTVSDFVDQPVATKIDPPAGKRVVIGSARKHR